MTDLDWLIGRVWTFTLTLILNSVQKIDRKMGNIAQCGRQNVPRNAHLNLHIFPKSCTTLRKAVMHSKISHYCYHIRFFSNGTHYCIKLSNHITAAIMLLHCYKGSSVICMPDRQKNKQINQMCLFHSLHLHYNHLDFAFIFIFIFLFVISYP